MNTQHTSGPWKVSKIGMDLAVYSETQQAFDLAHIRNGGNQNEVEANARLITAEPDMLAALKAAKAIKEGAALKSTSFKLEALIDIGKLLDAAIAKAEGRE